MRVVILTVVLATVLGIDAKQSLRTNRNACAGIPDGTFVADAESCSKFFVCYNGDAIAQSCNQGSYYNSTSSYCLPDTQNSCPQPQQQCTVDGEFSPHPKECSLFYVCSDGKLVEQSCLPGSYFNSTNLYCIPDTNNVCPQSECSENGAYSPHPTNCSLFNICYDGKLVEQSCNPGSYFDKTNLNCVPDINNVCSVAQCTEGEFVPHPTQCDLFYVCYNGLLVEQTCGNGSYFDKTNLYCKPDSENICWPLTPSTEAPCTCVGGYTNGQLIASPDSCYSYYVCSGGELLEQNCGYGNYFDSEKNVCEQDKDGSCWHNLVTESTTTTTEISSCGCPGGYGEGDFVSNSDSCHSYFICSQGELTAHSCGTGNYFDTSSKACMRDENGSCWPTTTSTTTTAPAPCQCAGGYEEGNLVEDRESCHSYFVCTQGELIPQSCGNGNYFDVSTKTCARDENGSCWPRTEPAPCQCAGGYEEGNLLEDTKSCHSYFVCTQGELIAQSCGNGNYFNASSKTCGRDVNGSCWPTTVPSPIPCAGGYEEGDLVANSDNCSSYFICSQGKLVEQDCGSGNYFDTTGKNCVKDVNGICQSKCTGGYDEGDLVANGDNCSSYFICSQGKLVEQDCGSGNYFDTTGKNCVDNADGICPTKCPGGYDESDLVANGDNCSSYFICSQGKLVEQDCGSGNYFDTTSKNCVKDVNGICQSKCTGGYDEGDLVANGDNCSSYFICSQGKLVEQECGSGYYFDAASKNCVDNADGICQSKCTGGYDEGDLVANGDNCSSYFICSQGKLVEQDCGSGYYFDVTNKTCSLDDNGFCGAKCPGGYDEGDLVANGDNCSSYFICSQGKLVEQECGSGYYFDTASKNCVDNADGICPTKCPGGYDESDLVANGDNCSSYFICSQGKLVEQDCGSGNYFDTTGKNCVKDVNGICQSKCTGGYDEGDLVANGDNCSSYFICSQGKLVEQECGSGYYFDAASKNCVDNADGLCPTKCPGGYDESDLVANGDNCSSYFICSQGKLVEQGCGSGNYFDTTSKNCVKDVNGICQSKCTGGYDEGDLVANGDNCSSYFICSQGKLVEQDCGSGYYFDVTNKTCSLDDNGICGAKCPGGYDEGDLVANGDNCSSYFICSQGKLVEQECGSGYYFDAASKNCVDNADGLCPTKCPGGYDESDLVANGDNCSSYFICSQGKLVEQDCGSGNYFDTTSKNCVKDVNGICQSKCTGGYDEGDLVANGDNCSSYFICSQGKLVEQDCGSGNYFDTTGKNCAKDVNGICQSKCTGGYDEGDLVANGDNCSSYFICSQGKLVEQDCGSGYYFDVTNKTCSLDNNGICGAKCPGGYDEGDLVANGDNCSSYFICSQGKLVEQECGSGYYFDAASKNCVDNADGICPTKCPGGYDESDLVSNGNNCSSYFICIQGKLLERDCGSGNYFDKSSKVCIVDVDGVCKPATEKPCTCPGGYEDGELVPYPGTCYKFYICFNGQLVEESCGQENYYDATSKSCVVDKTGVCREINTTPFTTTSSETTVPTSTPSSTSTIPSSTKPSTKAPSTTTSRTISSSEPPLTTTQSTTTEERFSCPGGYVEGELIPYPGSCYKFYICFNGVLLEESCHQGNYFDSISKSCVRDESGVCWPINSTPSTTLASTTKASTPTPSTTSTASTTQSTPTPSTDKPSTITPSTTKSTTTPSSESSSTGTQSTTPDATCFCPGGYEDGELIPYPGSCYKFYICYNGVLLEESCGQGNYFDSISKSCVRDESGVCWPINSTPSTTLASTTKASTPTPSTTSTASTTQSTPTPSTDKPSTITPSTTKSTTTPSSESSSTGTPSTTPDATCFCPGGYEDGELIPYPGSCYKFYICYNGVLLEKSCDQGNYFDSISKSCVRDESGVCWPINSTPSTTLASTTKASTPTPSTTSTASTTQSTPTPSTVKPSTITPSTTKSTTTPSSESSSTGTPSTTPDATCSCPGGYEDGELIPYPGSCYKFYICYNGVLLEESCDQGNYFDSISKSCVRDESGVCWPINSTPSTTLASTTKASTATPSTTSTASTTQSTPTPSTDKPSTITPSTTKSTTTPSSESSSTGTPSTTANATCSCPGGYEDGELIPYPGSCYKFYICYNGVLLEESCDQGNYFDYISKSCVRDESGVCWPINSTPSTTAASTVSGSTSTSSNISSSSTTLSSTMSSTTTSYATTPSSTLPSSTTASSTTAFTTTPSKTTETPCTCPGGYEQGEFVPYPGNCFKFYICYNGELLEESCGQGNYFDSTTKSCVTDKTEVCWPKMSTPSTSTASKTAISTTTPSTTTYSSTSSTPLSTTISSTTSPLSTVPSSTPLASTTPSTTSSSTKIAPITTPSTTPSSATPSTTTPSTCPGGYDDGKLVPYPGSCYKFYICFDGELVTKSCGEGVYFDSVSQSCVVDTAGVCWPVNSTPATTTIATVSTSSTTHSSTTPSSTISTTSTPSTKTSLPTTPSSTAPASSTPSTTSRSTRTTTISSTSSSSATGSTVSSSSTLPSTTASTTTASTTTSSLPSSTTASSTTPSSTTPSTTIPSQTTETPCACTGGYVDGEFIPHPDSCYLFYVCYQSELVEVSCGFGNYFDKVTKSCVLDTTGICWSRITSTSTTTATAATPCTCSGGYVDGDFVASPESCYEFYICYQGELNEMSCGTGNYFDNSTKSCALDTAGTCWSKPTNSPTTAVAPRVCPNGYQNGQIVSNPTACYMYYICIGGDLIEGDCGTGQYFNNTSSACETDTLGCCWPLIPTPQPGPYVCPNGLQEGQLTSIPSSCYLYNICHNGQFLQGNCGNGNYFNNATNACEADTGGCCWPLNPPFPPHPPSYGCNGLQEGQLISSPSSCYLYNICHKGQLLQGNCGNGNYFNNATNACEADTGGCCWPLNPPFPPHPPSYGCNGLQEGQLISSPSSCYLYNICHKGQLLQGNCGNGNYFNSATNACEADTSGSCWPSNPPFQPQPPSYGCNGLQEGQLISSPSSCYLYNICHKGQLLQGNCGNGNYFNSATNACEADTSGSCWPSNPPFQPQPPSYGCNGLQEGQLISSPSSCYLYNICHKGQLLQGNCGNGNYFNNATNACEADTGGCCWPLNPPFPPHPPSYGCNGLQEGQLISSPSSCYLYNICHKGQLLQGNCGNGNYFNSATNACEADTSGSCWPSNPPFQPQPPSYGCNGLQEGQLISSPSSCYLYNICHKGQLLQGNCGNGNYFNSATNACEADTSGSCWPSNPPFQPQPPSYGCNGLQEGQLISSPSSCYLYNICHNGQLLQGNCGNGNYFNSATNACEADTGGCCWPLNPPFPPHPPSYGCNGLQEGQLISSPSSCYLYNICHKGQLLQGNCGNGNYFNSATNACEADTSGSCWPSNPPFQPQPPSYGCNGLQEGQLISSPSSCYLYNICHKGQLLQGNCGNGNYFNNATNACEADTGGCCWPLNPPFPPHPPSYGCNGLQEGQLISSPSSCYLYNICHKGQLLQGNCGNGNYFNSATNACEADTSGSCWPSNPPFQPQPPSYGCNGLQEGQLISSPSSCYLYNICHKGQLLQGNCGNGNYFNNATNACEADTGGCCWPLNPPFPPHPPSYGCPNGMQGGQFTANPSSCYLYSICYNGQLLQGNCGNGNYFNSATSTCEADTSGRCWPLNPPFQPQPPSYGCPNGMQEGQFTANPSSCYLYSICYNGKLLQGNCGNGNYFNSATSTCEADTSGRCWPLNPPFQPQPPSYGCPNGMQEGQFTANPSSCYLYSICYNGQLLQGNCGNGNYFNSATSTCEADTSGRCWPLNPPFQPQPPSYGCPNGMQEGQFTANPSSCYLYSVCYNGQLVQGNCGTGNYFNSATRTCQADTSGTCWPLNSPSLPHPPSSGCPNGLQEGQFTASVSSCYLYNICHNGELVEGNCGIGNYFNTATKMCNIDTEGWCWPLNPPHVPQPEPCVCPNGLQEGQLASNPSSCYLYNICHNGELIEGNCGTGNYFNNVTNICEPDSGGCCWPSNAECPGGYANGDFVPDASQCDKFFICYQGALVPQDCGVGYFFDIFNNYCTRDINGTCWAVPTLNNTCNGVADGTFIVNETFCDKYSVCYNNTKIGQECGIGNYFNTDTLTCVHDTLGTCWKKVTNVCANAITGTFVPNPSNCQEFFVCYQNRAVLQQCGDGNWFNPQLLICQPDLAATCINICKGTTTSLSLPHPNCNQFYSCANGLTTRVGSCSKGANFDPTLGVCLTSAICEADLCAKSKDGVVYPVQTELGSFYSCSNRIPIKHSCPDGASFDPDLLICTPDTGRCIGKKNGFAVASYNNPNAYYVCKNNMAIFAQCPSYAIFDEKLNICVQAQRIRLANNKCATEPDGTMLPGDACNEYHLCLDGEDIAQNCGAYSSFNKKLGYCTLNLTCFNEAELCAKSSDTETFPDARYENVFIKCKRGLAVTEECPKYMVYSHDIGYCVPKELAMSSEELVQLCENASDNTMAPALDCRKFYICSMNVAILQQCASDQHFGVMTGTCLPDVERQCWMRSETLRGSFFIKTVCHEGQVRADRADCARYEICAYGVWTAQLCPTRQLFDSGSEVCVAGDAEQMCPRARSAECSDEVPLRASENACTDYYRCENNRWKAAKCPIGEFFSAQMATCTNDVGACARSKGIKSKKHCDANETRADEMSCGLFHVCHEGEWWYRYCEEGNYFNRSLAACTPNDGTCRSVSVAGPCRNGTAKKSDFDPCIAYHLCVDGNWTTQRCPSEHYFDETRKACMLDDGQRKCQNDIKFTSSSCKDGDRRYQSSNCIAFDICSFGNWLSVACPAQFYFDTSLKICMPTRGECSANGLLRRDCVENTSRPSPGNCSEFYYCSRSKWQLESCLEGFQYNATIDKCIQENSSCETGNTSYWMQSRCAGLKSGSSVAHESGCTKYYLCVDDLAVEAECSSGRFYDNESKYCELNNGACPLEMVADGSVCQDKSNGSHVQNPANCTTFFICSETFKLLSYCPPEHYFNADIGACQIDTGICNKPRLCDGNPGGRLPHETYCNIYYSCTRGKAIPVACEEDHIFDPTTRNCILDTEHRCVDGILVADEICAAADDGRPLVDSDDCTKYVVCTNGLAQTLQCPPGKFFDSNVMKCMSDDGSCPFVDGPDLPNNNTIPPDPITCIGKHGYLMPDPEHCNEMYVCIYGNLRHERCFDGEFFDLNTYSCSPWVDDEKCPTAGEMTAMCVNSEEATSFADQIDCRKYYQCNDGELQSKKCRNGESFDTLLGFCRQNDGTCLLENGQRVGACAGKHGKLAADSENCRGYFTCINGQKISEECDHGEYFVKATSRCEKDVNSTCRPVEGEFTNATQLSCDGLTELVFYPNIIDGCRTFFQCVKGKPRVHKCPDDLLFNGKTGICDWKDYVECIDMSQHYQTDKVCLNAINGTRYGNSEDNCDSYFICNDGKMKSFKCDQGHKYNAHSEKCDLAANVNCTMAA